MKTFLAILFASLAFLASAEEVIKTQRFDLRTGEREITTYNPVPGSKGRYSTSTQRYGGPVGANRQSYGSYKIEGGNLNPWVLDAPPRR